MFFTSFENLILNILYRITFFRYMLVYQYNTYIIINLFCKIYYI